MAYKFQIVLEFIGDSLADFDRAVALEDELTESLTEHEVDGHDIGQGVINLFILSDDAEVCFSHVYPLIVGSMLDFRAAGYRLVGSECFTRLWPANSSEKFSLP